jgi:hypothetical protein
MEDVTKPGDLVLQWVPVLDDRGRTRMESRWSIAAEAPALVAPVAPVTQGTHAA